MIVRSDHRDDHTVLVPPLTPIRRQNLNVFLVLQEMREELDLLTVQRHDSNLSFLDTAPQKCFDDLVREFTLHFVLDQVAHSRIEPGDVVRVHKDGFTTGAV